MTEQEFSEESVYSVDELPVNEMMHTDESPHHAGDGEFVMIVGNQYLTFELESVRCVDVTEINEEIENGSE